MAINNGQGDGNTPDRGSNLFVTAIVMVIIAGSFVIGRLAARGSAKKFRLDDYTIVLSIACSIGLTVTINLAVVNGYGKHKKDLTHEELMAALKWFYIAQILYKTEIGLTKISMICLYLRIFVDKFFRWLCYGTLFVIIGWTLGSTVATIFQCLPIAASWDKSIEGPVCTNSDAFWYAYGVINILTDAAILALPVRKILKLQMPRREKIGLLMVFLLGAFVIVTSIFRVVAVANSTKAKEDSTWSFIPRSIWTLIEANTGIVCACLPILKRPFVLLCPSILYNAPKGLSYEHSSRNRYSLNSHPASNTWATPDGIIVQSMVVGKPDLDSHARDSEEEEEIMASQQRSDGDRDIIQRRDIVVTYHCDRAESTQSLKDATVTLARGYL